MVQQNPEQVNQAKTEREIGKQLATSYVKEPTVRDFAPPSVRQARSAAAADAAARWEQLESELETTKAELVKLRSHVQVIEESNKILHEDAEGLRTENDRLKHEKAVIMTRIEAAGDVLIGLIKPIPPKDSEKKDQNVA